MEGVPLDNGLVIGIVQHTTQGITIPQLYSSGFSGLFGTVGEVVVRKYNSNAASINRFPCKNFLHWFVPQLLRVTLALDGVPLPIFHCNHVNALIPRAWSNLYSLIAKFAEQVSGKMFELVSFHLVDAGKAG
ncbi:MAG: hypothetical protein [Caudoviricetes sp.]|nr:MAG: hypothetical protein [Caudoviricetes sp.]